MGQTINYADFFADGWLKPKYLWQLRQEIVLGSIYVNDYCNSFAIDQHQVCDFFTNFWDGFCEELAKEDGVMEVAQREYDASDKKECVSDIYHRLCLELYDNEETLLRWYLCFDYNGPESSPLPPKMVNVDIHWDFARSIQVIAADENEAEEIVEAMMRDGSIPKESFEATEDWELDTTYQPE